MSTVNAIPTKATKAIVGAIIAGLLGALTAVSTALLNPATDWTSIATYLPIVIAGLVGSGLVGGSVYATTNAPKATIGVDTGIPTIPSAGE